MSKERLTQPTIDPTNELNPAVESLSPLVEYDTFPEYKYIYPSEEWAWMMGVLSVAGSISSTKIELISPHPELHDLFQLRGEMLFRASSQLFYRNSNKSPSVAFYSKSVASMLSDIRRNTWINALTNEHEWLLQDDKYIWSFLNGIFDVRGGVYKTGRKKLPTIFVANSPTLTEALFLSGLLSRVGITEPAVTRGQYVTIKILSLKDSKLFAENIYSVIPKKDGQLDVFRKIQKETKIKAYTEDEMIKEWFLIRTIIGHSPTTTEIKNLHDLELVNIDHRVYMRSQFGQGETKKSFKTARLKLDSMVQEKTIPLDETYVIKAKTIYEAYRAQQQKKAKINRSIARQKGNDEEYMSEWIKARRILGHVPSQYELDMLRKQNLIKYSYFLGRFGGDSKSFTVARDTLEKLAKEEEKALSMNEEDIQAAKILYEKYEAEKRQAESRRKSAVNKKFSEENLIQE